MAKSWPDGEIVLYSLSECGSRHLLGFDSLSECDSRHLLGFVSACS